MDKLYTVRDLTKLLGLSKVQVLLMIKNCEITATNISAGKKRATWRITATAVKDFMTRNSNTAKAQ